MATKIDKIVSNTKDLYMSDSAVTTIMDFERVLDELDMYVFKNWKKGELVKGPIYEKYFVTCTFMWPYKLMPDPSGGKRLTDYQCEVTYKKDRLAYPVQVKDPSDFRPDTKLPQTKYTPVWLVTITMPKSLMHEITQGSIDLEKETIDAQDIKDAYDSGEDENIYKDEQTQQVQQQNQMPNNGGMM